MNVFTVHQPQFLPWAGFWAKLDLATCTVLMSGVQYDKGGVTNRVKIEDEWVTVPVHVPENGLLRDTTYDPRCLRKIVATIEQKLMNKHIPFRSRLDPIMSMFVSLAKNESLALLNYELIRVIGQVLKTGGRIVHDTDVMQAPTKTGRLRELIMKNMNSGERNFDDNLRGTFQPWYLSGGGGREYLEPMQGFRTMYVEGKWEDCSVLQIIAKEEDPLRIIRGGAKLTPAC